MKNKSQKVAEIVLVFVAIVFALALVFKCCHWPGGTLLTLLSVLLSGILAARFVAKMPYRPAGAGEADEKTLARRWRTVCNWGCTTLILITVDIIFKLSWWPGGTILMILSVIFFIVTMVIALCYRVRRNRVESAPAQWGAACNAMLCLAMLVLLVLVVAPMRDRTNTRLYNDLRQNNEFATTQQASAPLGSKIKFSQHYMSSIIATTDTVIARDDNGVAADTILQTRMDTIAVGYQIRHEMLNILGPDNSYRPIAHIDYITDGWLQLTPITTSGATTPILYKGSLAE